MVPTGKSISVAVALRACVCACEAVCGRVRDEAFSGAGPKNYEFSGGRGGVVPGPAWHARR